MSLPAFVWPIPVNPVTGHGAGSSLKTSAGPSEESEACLPGEEDVGMKERGPGSRGRGGAPGPAPGSLCLQAAGGLGSHGGWSPISGGGWGPGLQAG